jgi:hypothetical protein
MDDYYANLLALQKSNTDFFYLWRDGDEQIYEYDKNRRRFVLDHMRFPRPGRWPGHGRRYGPHRPRPHIYRIQKSRGHKGSEDTRHAAENIAAALDAELRFAGLRVGKILGWGGLGIACAVDGEKANGEPIKVVCKAALSADAGMEEEKQNHVLTAGARHIVQRVVLVDGPEEERTAQGRNRRRMDASDDVLLIEFMRRGDLNGILNKASLRKKPFPSQVLWQIFDCLFRGVVGMAFPGEWAWPGENPERERIPQRTEWFDGLMQMRLNTVNNTMVHFDLDPLNILVGDFDDHEHNIVPVVKIADLGLAQNVDMQFRLKSRRMWESRRLGKLHIYTPEQFAEEWDYIKEAPIYHLDSTERETAGNYHWWTNMYQVAQVMWQLITLCYLEWPPVLEEYYETLPDGSEAKRWSYGAVLLSEEFNHIDPALRQLVAICMNHNPLDRPNMAHIDTTMKRYVRTERLSVQQRLQMEDFWESMYGDPPSLPLASQAATLAAVAEAAAATAAAQAQAAAWGPPASAPARQGRAVPPSRAGRQAAASMSIRPGATRVQFQGAPPDQGAPPPVVHRGPMMPFPATKDVTKQKREPYIYGAGW